MNYKIELNGGKATLIWRWGSGKTVEIVDISVDQSCRMQGWGRKLLEELFAQVKDGATLVFAITRAENEPAQEFYEATKFRVIAPLRRFYNETDGYGIDAVMYGRSPKGPV